MAGESFRFDLSNFDLCIVLSLFPFFTCLSLLVGRRASSRARVPTHAFRQSSTSIGHILIVVASEPTQTAVTPRIPVLCGPSRQDAFPLAEIPASTVFHLEDESY